MRINISKAIKYIIDNVNLVEYLSNYEGLSFKKYGNNYRTICPLHPDSDPSFSITVGKDHVWHCFGCKEGGSLITFVEKAHDLNRSQAVSQILNNLDINLSEFIIEDEIGSSGYDLLVDAHKFFMNQTDNEKFIDYFKDKGHNIEYLIKQGVGYCQNPNGLIQHLMQIGWDEKLIWKYKLDGRFEDAVVYPIYDLHGVLRYFKCRLLSSDIKNVGGDDTIPSYSDDLFYGLHTLKSNKPLILVEGDSDYLAIHSMGHNVLCMGGLKITDKLIKIIKIHEIEELYLWTDGDQAGWNFINNCMQDYANLFIKNGINCNVIYEKGHDPDELILSGYDIDVALKEAKLLPIYYIDDNFDYRSTGYFFIDKILKLTRDYDNLNRDIVISHLSTVTAMSSESIYDRFLTVMDNNFCDVDAEKYAISAILNDSSIVTRYNILPKLFLTKSASIICEILINTNFDILNLKNNVPGWLYPYFESLPIASPEHVGRYIKDLKDLYNKRQTRMMAKRILISTDDYESDIAILSREISNFYRSHGDQDQTFYDSTVGIINRLIGEDVKFGLNFGVGWEKTNSILLGLLPKLIMLMGNTGHGKTNVLLNWIYNFSILNDHKGLLFTGEMDHVEISSRLISIHTGVSSSNITINNVCESDIKKMIDLSTSMNKRSLFISEEMQIDSVINYAKYMKVKYDIEYIGFDYAQMAIPSRDVARATKTEQMKDMSRKFKQLSRELKIPIILLGQLSDDALDDAIPSVRRSSESKLMTHDADVAIAMRKKSKKEKDLNPAGDILFHIDKVRYNVDKVLFNLNFDRNTLRISED